MNQTVIYLASGSPRRRELLAQMGVQFEPCVVDVDETAQQNEPASQLVQRLSLLKSTTAQTQMDDPHSVFIGADTIVKVAGEIFGKPRDRQHALTMMAAMSGREHQVFTGVSVIRGDVQRTILQVSQVTMRETSELERQKYWHDGEPKDKAGAYGVQGLGAIFVSHIQGSYSGVMGLPICETAQLLTQVGCPPL